jgi:hypothetical protein
MAPALARSQRYALSFNEFHELLRVEAQVELAIQIGACRVRKFQSVKHQGIHVEPYSVLRFFLDGVMAADNDLQIAVVARKDHTVLLEPDREMFKILVAAPQKFV